MRRSPSEQRLLAIASPPVAFREAGESEGWEPTLGSLTETLEGPALAAASAPPRPITTPPRGMPVPTRLDGRVTAPPGLPRLQPLPAMRNAISPVAATAEPRALRSAARERAVDAVLWSHVLLALTASLYYGHALICRVFE